MEEALDGLMASAELFREHILTTDKDLSTNELEDECKAATGFDFTRFANTTLQIWRVVQLRQTKINKDPSVEETVWQW
ncbi:MAG: hypothetical protein K6E98_05360, partial [Lachnospiraceae bacterium]|nr:hypothetical protein [Lachnospiraceae bacterium]